MHVETINCSRGSSSFVEMLPPKKLARLSKVVLHEVLRVVFLFLPVSHTTKTLSKPAPTHVRDGFLSAPPARSWLLLKSTAPIERFRAVTPFSAQVPFFRLVRAPRRWSFLWCFRCPEHFQVVWGCFLGPMAASSPLAQNKRVGNLTTRLCFRRKTNL